MVSQSIIRTWCSGTRHISRMILLRRLDISLAPNSNHSSGKSSKSSLPEDGRQNAMFWQGLLPITGEVPLFVCVNDQSRSLSLLLKRYTHFVAFNPRLLKNSQ